jgi:hypothetical protein
MGARTKTKLHAIRRWEDLVAQIDAVDQLLNVTSCVSPPARAALLD